MHRTLHPQLRLTLLGLLLPFLYFSCASFALPPGQGAVERTLALIDSGAMAAVPGRASAPFLLDGEILLRQADLDSLWSNLAAARLRLGPATIVSLGKVAAPFPAGFPNTMEARSFIARRLDASARLVLLDTAAGPWWLILEGQGLGGSRLRGIGGPLK